ncbi:MAG: oligosaccharide flippase family protein [Candidatus Cloacimonetes bacterium]|nr:oligosaccharide flippase family protein [Candidatus Cloacimonadota bacterium]NLO11716.1 oligosaccharide flippase family protein [Candidatus Cloacimonadota bacterium]
MAEIDLKKNIFISASFKAVTMLLAFLAGWISTRFLGVELKGQYSYLITISSFAWIVLDLGIHKTYPYLIRKGPHNSNLLYTWSLLQFGVEFILLAGLGLAFTPFFSSVLDFSFTPAIIALVAGAISLTKLQLHMQAYYLGQDKVKLNSWWQTLNSLVMLLVLGGGYLFFEGNRLLYVLIAYNVAMGCAVIAYISPHLFTRFWKGFRIKYLMDAYSMGWRVFLSSIFIMMLIRFDVVLIRKLLDYRNLGIYAVAANVVDMLQLASNLVGSLLLVKLADTNDDVERWKLLKEVFIYFFLLLGLANLGFVAVGKPLLTFLYGKDFTPVYNVYLWLIPASFGLSFGSLFNTYLWSKGFPLISVILPIAAVLLNISLDLLLIPVMGIKGAALATSISYLAWFFAILIYEHYHSGKRILLHLVPSWQDMVNASLYPFKELKKMIGR